MDENITNSCIICDGPAVLNLLTDSLEDEEMLLHEALEFVICLDVDINDITSRFLCLSCGKKLLEAFRFKNQAMNAFKALKHLKSISDHPKIEQPDTSHYIIMDEDERVFTDYIVKEEPTILDSPNEDESIIDNSKEFEIDLSTDAVEFLLEHQKLASKNTETTLNDVDNSKSSCSLNNKIHKTKPTNYCCEVCQKRFQKKSNLIDHLRLHANEKNFACPYCEKKFVQIANYRTHLRVHTGERPFHCHLCPNTYSQSSTLKTHIKSHTNDRTHICATCNKGFFTSSDLKKHQKTHNPVKEFECSLCDRQFSQKVNLKLHQMKVHKLENCEIRISKNFDSNYV